MASKKAVVRQIQGITFAAKTEGGPWVVMDGPGSFGGNDGGARPKELLLFALGGCTGSDVVSILKKKRVPLEGFEIRLSGEVRDVHPQIFTSIHIEYVFHGDGIMAADVERAIELSTTKYCSVSAMLKESVTITHSYQIKERELAAPQPTGADCSILQGDRREDRGRRKP
jgi:putative redox protein